MTVVFLGRPFPPRCLIVALLCLGCRGSDTSAKTLDAGDTESARHFAQTFYDWYVPLSDRVPAAHMDSVMARGHELFTPTLLQALQRDVEAQRDAADIFSVVGDYDPFLNSQDPCTKYVVQAVERRGGGWQAMVEAQCGNGSSTSAVLVDMVRDGVTWRFANFRNPDQPAYDLVSQLRAVQAQRDSVSQSDSARSFVIVLTRDVRVVDRGAAPEVRGVLYGDTSLVLPRGTELTMIRIGLEGGCTVRHGALMLSLTSCPWLDGFTDHQSDIFLRRDMPAVAR